MRACQITSPNGIDGLELTGPGEGRPGPNEVLVRIRAVSLNYRDLNTVRYAGQRNLRLPFTPCSDGAGEVLEVGALVSRVRPGDRVAGIFVQSWLDGEMPADAIASSLGGGLDGVLAEQVVLPQDGLVHLPRHLSYEEAATLPCAGVTAWHALVSRGVLKAGDTVLVQGTGGVSIVALQFALMTGARVIATSSSDEKLERVRKLGPVEGINYASTPDWDQRVLELTDGVGVDHVVEVGGAGTLERSFRAARVGGTISLIGLLSGAAQVDPMPVLTKRLRVQGVYVGSRRMFEDMDRAMALHQMRPVIDRAYSLDEAPDAFRLMESAGHFGKITIVL